MPSEEFYRHMDELLEEQGEIATEMWCELALKAAERDFEMVNKILGGMGMHPLTWTPPLIRIALEKLQKDSDGR